LRAAALAPEDEAVDARLEPVFEVGERIEVEGEEAFSVAVPDGVREEIADEALLVVWTGARCWRSAAREDSKGEPWGSQGDVIGGLMVIMRLVKEVRADAVPTSAC